MMVTCYSIRYTEIYFFPITGIDIGFVNAAYTVSEADSSVEVCAELVNSEADITVQVQLRTQPGNAQGIF